MNIEHIQGEALDFCVWLAISVEGGDVVDEDVIKDASYYTREYHSPVRTCRQFADICDAYVSGVFSHGKRWFAEGCERSAHGSTATEAIYRLYVTIVLGDSIEIPEEFL